MSKRKAKQAPPLFREFKQWPLEQAMAAAQMLYASHEQIRNFVGLVTGDADGKSIKLPWDEPFRWNFLARLAFEFLDHLSHACETVARENAADARTRAEAEQLPDLVPFERALRFITRQRTIKQAREKFEKIRRADPDYFDPGGIMALWQKSGIPRGYLGIFRLYCDNMSSHIKAERNRANARKRKREKKGVKAKQQGTKQFAEFASSLSDRHDVARKKVRHAIQDSGAEIDKKAKEAALGSWLQGKLSLGENGSGNSCPCGAVRTTIRML